MQVTAQCNGTFTVAIANNGKSIRDDSRQLMDSVDGFNVSQNPVSANKRLHIEKRSVERSKTDSERFFERREREYNIIRSHVNKHVCRKQLAVFVKYQDGTKYLAALVDFHKRGKKLYGGSLSPVLWFDVSIGYKRTLRGMIDVSDTLPESVMRKMLGIYEKDVHVYAQSLESVNAPRKPGSNLRYEKIRAPRYRATGNVLYCKPVDPQPAPRML